MLDFLLNLSFLTRNLQIVFLLAICKLLLAQNFLVSTGLPYNLIDLSSLPLCTDRPIKITHGNFWPLLICSTWEIRHSLLCFYFVNDLLCVDHFLQFADIAWKLWNSLEFAISKLDFLVVHLIFIVGKLKTGQYLT